jgi:hypothetical protein
MHYVWISCGLFYSHNPVCSFWVIAKLCLPQGAVSCQPAVPLS